MHRLKATFKSQPKKQASLIRTIKKNNIEKIKALLSAGTNPNFEDKEHNTPLTLAISGGNPEIVNALIKAGASTESDSMYLPERPISMAIKTNNLQMVNAFVESKTFKNNIRLDQGIGALYFALESKADIEIFKTLIKAGIEVKDCHWYGRNIFELAVDYGRIDLFDFLLKEAKADVNSGVLRSAIENNQIELVKKLIAAGADLNKQVDKSDVGTPLHYAAETGNLEMIQLLLDNGATIVRDSSHGKTPLHIAIQYGKVEAVKMLLKVEPRLLEAKDKYGCTPLHYAISDRGRGFTDETKKEHINIFKLLVESKANVNAITREADKLCTPLHLAVLQLEPEVVEILLKAGASESKDSKGQTPYDQLKSEPGDGGHYFRSEKTEERRVIEGMLQRHTLVQGLVQKESGLHQLSSNEIADLNVVKLLFDFGAFSNKPLKEHTLDVVEEDYVGKPQDPKKDDFLAPAETKTETIPPITVTAEKPVELPEDTLPKLMEQLKELFENLNEVCRSEGQQAQIEKLNNVYKKYVAEEVNGDALKQALINAKRVVMLAQPNERISTVLQNIINLIATIPEQKPDPLSRNFR